MNRHLVTLICITLPVVLLVIAAELIDDRLLTRLATTLCINMILVLGLQIFTGNSGILSFAHIGFMGIGAYTSAVITMPARLKSMALPELYPIMQGVQLDPLVGMAIGGVVAALVAAIVAYPLMRLSDAAAVITSFALLMILHTIMVHWSEVTNGPRTLFGIVEATTLQLAAAAAVVAAIGAYWFKESRVGILLRAVRNDEVAAAAIGAHIPLLRWRAYVLSAFYAGIGGALWAHFITSFSPNAFYLRETFVILGMLVIGGPATVSGAVFGVFSVTAVFEGLRALEKAINAADLFSSTVVGLTEIILALVMLIVLILRPGGIIERNEFGTLARWPFMKKQNSSRGE
ncbi:MAG: branched-chain amino acid ABC transporter permease [Desulfofustis sp. PB-SRB1]|mgnify:CR=1 FL=1|jgi:branched-chain amino acid transport system permease protein|nr:branched-chain amino acid ABC transporter permease [Desulfofustis sp. PB-SRB1]MBM1003061.1 branched-chain amino acid ABC transporter permease [Desulfofustis sp. PB-SRB1]HBH29441.1 branched-chain amino acid ABC transporter permease [Desulfofustis sp.]